MISESIKTRLEMIDQWLAERGQIRENVIWCYTKHEIWIWCFVDGKNEMIIETAFPELVDQMLTMFPNLLFSDDFWKSDIEESFKDHNESFASYIHT